MATNEPAVRTGDPAAHASGLARLAGMLRAEAANGLFWGTDPDEEARLLRLRELAAALLAEVDPRPFDAILRIFEADSGLRTPMPGIEFRVDCADGTRIVRRRRLRSRTLGQCLDATAAALGGAVPSEPVGIADTDLAGLPCPHTYLLVYEFATALDADAVEQVLEPGDPDLDGDVPSLAPASSAVVPDNGPLPVSPAAHALLDAVAALAKESLASVRNVYEVERQHRIAGLCERAVPTELDYPRLDCGDLAAPGVATGADTAIFDDEGRLLVIKRTDTGQWAMPGGAAEVGESVGLAAVREAFEETGLDVELTGLVVAFDKRDTDLGDSRMPMIMSFAARALDPDQPLRLAELEASDARWITRAEAAEADLFRGHELRVPIAFARNAVER
ncbi:NUDIX hydrolase N-terminal domain-containing protein [Glycomyces sp. TRM65418]|uniref:NUDIX hydrolase n=1 Tax=Glycomyces sp. TRM65418 TaxID=2867006 RepID=UPI001CE5419F|nr:NUDIX domain-containing protein [Glycomyces sp. TRM65418]MCC3763089.1 NUDIX hydrolase N-terminal domain-containing protein [Glycomyces sp. TRM65418]QZD57098.1 NUDIX hydrolase N-terminal domain-containing protein [Glycomyces sp. TRM65418]